MWDFSFQKESTDNHDWSPGRLGAGYIHARTNTPDSFDLLNYSIRTWNIGPDYTDDIDRELRRTRPTDTIVFKFFITPTGGITDRGEGFKNRTGKSDKAVIAFLHRKDNRLYDGRNDIKTSAVENPEPHFNPETGEPCYCSMGSNPPELEAKTAYTKYKDVKRGILPKQINENQDKLQEYIVALVEGADQEGREGIKKLVPWLIEQLKKGQEKGGLKFIPNEISRYPDGRPYLNGHETPARFVFGSENIPVTLTDHDLTALTRFFNADESPFREGFDLMNEPVFHTLSLATEHKMWVKEREEKARQKAVEENQPVVHRFDDPEGWYVTKLNPSAEEAELEGVIQGNCFQQASMGYQKAVEDSLLDVYVLRDPKGRHHALWAYNPDGSIAVMESNSKMYSQESNWQGYAIHDPEIRELISRANEALGLSNEYNGWSKKGEHFRRPPVIQLPEVNTVDEFLVQFSDRLDFANAWLGPDYANRFDALIEKMAKEQNVAMDLSPEVNKGNVDWNNITNDLFNGPTGEQIGFDLFMKVLDEYPYADLDFVKAADSIVNGSSPEKFLNQGNLNAYKEWRQLHSHPYTGEYMMPVSYVNNNYDKKDYERLRELYQKNPWAKQLPPWEEFISEWGGKIPASLDPQHLQDNPAKEPSRYKGRDKDILLPDTDDPRVQNREIERRQRVYEEPSGQLFLAKTATDPALHFNTETGRPCYCGFGQSKRAKALVREANLKYKDIKRGEIPKWMNEDEAQQLQKFLTAIVEGGSGYRATPGIKKIVPWLIQQLKNETLVFDSGKREIERLSRDPSFIIADKGSKSGRRLSFDELEQISYLFNAEESPYRLELSTCEACDGKGSYEEETEIGPGWSGLVMCDKCQGWGNRPTGNKKIDLNQLSSSDVLERTERHQDWVKEREEIAENKERVKDQEVTHQFDNGWYVTRLNPSAEEARWEGIAQGNCFQSDLQPYQRGVAEGRLTVYVLRDKDGRGHALWAYNPDGSIAVMEDCSKMYNTEGSGWEGYRINNRWIRDMVSEANAAMGLDNSYDGHNVDFEEPEEQYETHYQLFPVETIGELLEQYAEDANLFDLALNQIDNVNDDVNINDDTIIYLGEIDWQSVAYDFFGERRDALQGLTILNDITAIAQKHGENFFDNFVTAFDQDAQSYEATAEAKGEEDEEVEAWKQWKALHTNPFTGEIQFPRDAYEYGHPHRTPEPTTETGWEFEYPTGEQVEQWGGVMPASVDPDIKRGRPMMEKVPCAHCDGEGESKLWDGSCDVCGGTGMRDAQISFPSIQDRKKIMEEEGSENWPAPAAWLREDPATGQLFFSKKKKWNMTPLTFADQLKDHVASIEPKVSHSLSWVKGGKGRGLMLNDGSLITWPVNKKGEPQHPDMYEYLTGEKLPPAFLPEHFTEGTPFDIYEDGTLAFFSNDVPADLVSDLSKIDYRLKVSKIAANNYDMYDFHFNCNTGKKCFCRYDGVSKRDQIMRRREASQTVRKVKNQKQKFLQNEKGDAILDFLHRLISGHGIEERGEFGEGQFPGLEKMVPWIVKQIKTGHIRSEFDPDGKVTRMRYFYANEEAAKQEIGKVLQGDTIYVYLGPPGIHHNELREAVERKRGYNFKINTESPEEAKVAVINAHDLSYEKTAELIESLPGQIETIYMVTPLLDAYDEEDRWKQLPERYRDVTIDLISPTRTNAVNQALSSAGRASLNENPDISRVPLSAVGDENFMTIHWGNWSDWFNAPNSPARRSRSEDEVRGAINRGIKRAQYLNERHNQDIDLTPTYSNDKLIGLIAEQLGVEYQDLYRDWLNIDSNNDKSLNDIIKELVQKYNRNIDQMKPDDVVDASRQHAKYIAELERRERLIKAFADTKDSGVVYRITDPAHKGWTVHQIKNREEAELESEAMGHCIGNEDQAYAHNIDNGNIEAFSLRDEDGLPKLTWHYNPDGTLGSIQGKSNNAMPQFRHMVTEFNKAMNRDDDDGGSGHEDGLQGEEEAYIRLPDPDTMSEYVAQVEDPWQVAQEVADYEDLVIGEATEYERGDPDWERIAEEFVELQDVYYRNNSAIVEELFRALIQDGEMIQFLEKVRENIEYYEYDPEDYPIVDWVKLWNRLNYNKERGRVTAPRMFHNKESYEGFIDKVIESYGHEAANRLPKWEDLADISGLGEGRTYNRYLPTNFIPQAAGSELEARPDVCPTCGGKGYNYGAGQNISQARLCPTCNGEGVAEFSEESMPQELWQFNAPVSETPIETADWSMLNQVVCDNCKGQGKVLLPKLRSWYPDEYAPCQECGGDGHKTAKISLKEKATAWDLPAHKLSKLQIRYINGEL